ncbi:12472_t:CDS:2 [Entrophospora sp. SA101]|nr:12472_t:CDS:2 [Entrophospora sp. SA101]CAJ0843580.1 6082_t:CDS:2 [Entrophospora sp. SA101]
MVGDQHCQEFISVVRISHQSNAPPLNSNDMGPSASLPVDNDAD